MFKEWNDAVMPALSRLHNTHQWARIGERLIQFKSELGSPQLRLIPHPLVFDRAHYEAISSAAVLILNAQGKLALELMRRYSRADLVQRMGLPAEWAAYIDWTQLADGRHRVARADIVAASTFLGICELNFSVAVGGGELYDYFQVFADSLNLAEDERGISPFANLARLYRDTCRQHPFEQIILLDWSSHAAMGYAKGDIAKRYLSAEFSGMDVQCHDEESLVKLWRGRGDLGGSLIHRCFTFDDVTCNQQIYGELLQRGARFSNGLEAELLMSKAWLAMLWDSTNHALFSSEEIQAIKAYLLPTWEVTADQRDWLMEEKDQLIFKQKNSYGGAGIVLGRGLSSQALWEQLQLEGIDTWVAQRIAECSMLTHAADPGAPLSPHRQVLGLYLHGERSSGVVVRSGNQSVIINAGSGAAAGWAPALTEQQRQSLSDRVLSML